MDALLGRYGNLLEEVDRWFADALQKRPDLIRCRTGCSACCRGLFDITILDALYLHSGFALLPEEVRHALSLKAVARLDQLQSSNPVFSAPWVLNRLPEAEWDELMPEDDETPCILLGDDGRCLVYGYRPMTCRLNGIPLFDSSGEALSDEWCTLNFVDADPEQFEDIRHPFRELFAQELLLHREATRHLLAAPLNELDTVIPAALLLDEETLRKAGGGLYDATKGVTP